MSVHNVEYRVYYEDTDAGGIMYHGRYVNWCERARAEYLRHHGLTFSGVQKTLGVVFVVRHIEADYLAPATLDDLLRIETSTKEMKNSSFVIKHSVFREETMLFSMAVTIVCVGETLRPVRIPETIRTALSPMAGPEGE